MGTCRNGYQHRTTPTKNEPALHISRCTVASLSDSQESRLDPDGSHFFMYLLSTKLFISLQIFFIFTSCWLGNTTIVFDRVGMIPGLVVQFSFCFEVTGFLFDLIHLVGGKNTLEPGMETGKKQALRCMRCIESFERSRYSLGNGVAFGFCFYFISAIQRVCLFLYFSAPSSLVHCNSTLKTNSHINRAVTCRSEYEI